MSHTVHLNFESISEELRNAKLEILKAIGITQTSFELTIESDEIPSKLLWASRAFHMDHTEVYFFFSYAQSPIESISRVQSPQNELRVLIFLTKEFSNIQDDEMRRVAQALLLPLLEEYSRSVPISKTKSIMKDEASLALSQWASENQYEHHLELADFEDTGRGMALKSHVGAQEAMISCDAGLFLSIFSALKSETLGPVFEQLESLDDDSKLILFVIYEKFVNPSSFWKPYLEHLPETIDSALYFTEEDLEYVAGTTLGMEIGIIQSHLLESYQEIMLAVAEHPVFDPNIFTWERFKWARAIFDSRGFNLTLQGKARNCLLPFIDSINSTHYTHLQTRGYIDETKKGKFSDLGTYVLPTLVPCSQLGNQIFLNYGGFSTRELVLFYGFAYENEHNPYDLFTLTLDLPEDDYAAERMVLANKLGISVDHFLRAGSISNDLIFYLSLIILPSSQVIEADKLSLNDLKTLLLSDEQMESVTSTLKSLLEALSENLLSENPFLSSPPESFPSTRSRLGYCYARSQLHILNSSLQALNQCTQNKQ